MANKWICLTDKERQDIIDVFTGYGGYNCSALQKIKNADKRIAISSAKGKGRNLQYWVCERISKLIGIPYNQQDDQCLIHSREMGQVGVDIILRGEVQKQFPFSIECKSTESMNFIKTIIQAISNQAEKTDWMIVHRCKAFSPVVVISWDTFEKLFRGSI
jgi:hypothetical protein